MADAAPWQAGLCPRWPLAGDSGDKVGATSWGQKTTGSLSSTALPEAQLWPSTEMWGQGL